MRLGGKRPLRITDLSVEECREFFQSLGEPSYRADQILEWIYRNRVGSYRDMTNIPVALRSKLESVAPIKPASTAAISISPDGTVKRLLEYDDGATVETVLMPHDYGVSLCVSSQVGCAMGCKFCASGALGFVRNLSVGEMMDQVIGASASLPEGSRIGSVVIMGTGEPLLNYDNVLKFIRLINWNRGFSIGYRHISLSTAGIIPGIVRLSQEGLPITLSVSLHAPDDHTRTKLMPIAGKYGVRNLVRTCIDYSENTGRRVTYEYALIKGVNDSPAHSRRLVGLIRGTLCHVNLIPLNPVRESSYKRSDPKTVSEFRQALAEAGIESTVRREMGTGIDAACGQLRAAHSKKR